MLFGKIAKNVMWKPNTYQLLMDLPQSILKRLMAELQIGLKKGYYGQ